MIQIYKLPPTDPQVLTQLDKVNPWWTKKINTRIHKAKQMIGKFGLQANDYIPFDQLAQTNIQGLIQAVNNYLNFYIPKLKIIVNNRDAFKKFDDSIINYMNLNGNVSAIQTIALFYTHIQADDNTQLNKINALTFANHIIAEKWKRYQKEVTSVFGTNTLIKQRLSQLFAEVIEFKTELFDTRILLTWLVKYASRLFKAGEINEKQFLNVMYLSYLQLSYNEGFIEIYKHFIRNLN